MHAKNAFLHSDLKGEAYMILLTEDSKKKNDSTVRLSSIRLNRKGMSTKEGFLLTEAVTRA